MVANALSRKSSNLAVLYGELFLFDEFGDLELTVKLVSDKVALSAMSVFRPILIQQIKDEQFADPKLARIDIILQIDLTFVWWMDSCTSRINCMFRRLRT